MASMDSETPDSPSVQAARLVSQGVAAVCGVRQAYIYPEEQRDKFVELPDCVPADTRASHVEELSRAMRCMELGLAAASWREQLRKGLVSCGVVGVLRPYTLGIRCGSGATVTASSLLDP